MLFDVILNATEEELLDGWKRAQVRRATTSRLVIQTVLLAAVAAWSLIAFVGDGMKDISSLLIGLVALGLIPVMWLVPTWQIRQTVKELADSETKPHLWVFEDGLDVSETEPQNAYFDFSSVIAIAPAETAALQTLVLRFRGGDVLVVPRRLLTDEQWETLLRLTDASARG